ncbi:hypothetical protein LSTR_LSTR006420 [Laodelphax striatellus]|uniref:VWFC domain-containing protein n=1 Tax=Laodelphax striatellus TaxID=195883 RepID=A0A482WXX5_LAOST|nr:hypothetical protein LSTR_LSTR006420 [Laodelphax striatellus]
MSDHRQTQVVHHIHTVTSFINMSSFNSLLFLIAVITFGSKLSEGLSGNCTDSDCEQDVIASACPPDSIPDPANPAEGGCVCSTDRCLPPPTCTPPATHRLQRPASGEPSNCCDVYECVDPPAVNCSSVTCPEEGGPCPADSYRLPAHRAEGDCCSLPQECQCLPEPCRLPECQPPLWPKVVRPGNGNPGSCCALFKCVENESNNTCTDEEQSWRESECTLCTCKNGLKLCETDPPCPQLPEGCSKTRVPKGKCCPVCMDGPEKTEPDLNGCFTSRGKFKRNGDTWQTDPCTACTCDNGKRRCVVSVCEPCSNPIYQPGECCPVCDESSVVTLPPNCQAFNCTLRCVHGFVRDSEGCFTCQCQQDECRLDCPYGYVKDKHGNKLCECAGAGVSSQCPSMAGCRKSCPHGLRLNKAGCPVCKCDSCKPLSADCSKNCAHGFAKNSNGCPICKCLPSPDSRTQNTAVSVEGKSYCFHLDDDVVHEDGEVWFDGCRHCYCRDGIEMCSPLLCPPVNCSAHLVNTTGCCPSCPGEDLSPKKHVVCGEDGSGGDLHVEGDQWQLAGDSSVECMCQDGRTYCHAPECPPAPCDFQTLVTSNLGCSHCSAKLDNTSVKLTTTCDSHPTESVWRESKCVSCLCDNGHAICFEETCQSVAACKHPLHIKGHCCPICLDHLGSTAAATTLATPTLGCLVANASTRLYQPGDTWAISDCISCQCLDVGQTLCTKEVCPFTCASAVKAPGKCCPVCPTTSSDGGALKDSSRGAVFIVIVSLVICTMLVLVFLVGRQCRMRRQVKLSAYGCPPPQYHQYKIVTAFEASQAPSIRTTEKSALSPV